MSTVVYPVLGSKIDLWVARVAGYGLGNCFYTYFHAVALADKYGASVVAPPWFSLKLGPLLRGEASKRLYWRMFKPFAGEIHGLTKLLTLLMSYRNRVVIQIGGVEEPVVVRNTLNFVESSKLTFLGLHAHREAIRRRLLGITTDPVPDNHRWGGGNYIAIHVRLGDFTEVAEQSVVSSGKPNVRIPLEWYIKVMSALRSRFPHLAIYVFSDGNASSLQPLCERGAKIYRSGSDMTDLLAMAGASVLVGSNSTYSWWAAFLGNMPSIWLKTSPAAEKPSAPEAPALYIPLDCIEPELWD